MVASPNILNYTIGKGQPFFTPILPNGSYGTERSMGNPVEFEFTPTVQTLEHNSNLEGVRSVDRKVVVSLSGELRVVLDELTLDNLALATLAEVTGNVGEILSVSSLAGKVRFEQTNSVGPRYEWIFPRVEFTPDAAVPIVSEEWNQIELTGTVTKKDGSFGTFELIAEEGDDSSEESST